MIGIPIIWVGVDSLTYKIMMLNGVAGGRFELPKAFATGYFITARK